MDIQKALLVYRVDRSDVTNSGVINKLGGQVEGLEQLGIEADYITHSGHAIYKNQVLLAKAKFTFSNLIFKFQFWKYMPVRLEQYDLIIIRHTLMVPSFLKWLKVIRKLHPELIIIIDMPTYPYELEWSGWKKQLGLYFDRKSRNQLSELVNYMFHSGNEKEIFGIPTILLGNGVAPYRYHKINSWSRSTIHMIAVGKWQYWHGLDRLLRGMYSYEGGTPIQLTIVGDGPVLIYLRQLSRDLGLEDLVHFAGMKQGKALDELYERATMGIGTLALHRKQVNIDSSLKHREYCARGLPFVASSPDVDFPADLEFVHYAPINENDIDLEKLIDFVKRLDQGVGQKMIKYATEHIAWHIKLKKALAHL